jgi:opacity protein-like surface antigen
MKNNCVFPLLLMLSTSTGIHAQQIKKSSGMLSFGTRITSSMFSGHDGGAVGIGVGGQTRIQLSDKVNTEWFGDFIPSSIENRASRTDYHVGWSLMFYPGRKTDFSGFLQPYILAGHCFDYTRIEEDADNTNFKDRWSMAMQAGAGMHFNVTPRFDFSLSTQYMLHLGKDIHADVLANDQVVIEKSNASKPEGHLLVTVSINYKIANLW